MKKVAPSYPAESARPERADRASAPHLPAVTSPPPFRYAERQPAPPLHEWLLSYWHFAGSAAPPVEEPYSVPPDGCASLAVLKLPSLSPMVLCMGPRVTALRPGIVPGMQLAGIRLWPDVTHALLGADPQQLRDHQGPPPPAMNRAVSSLAAAVAPHMTANDPTEPGPIFDALERWARQAFPDPLPPEPRVRRAVRAIAAARGECTLAHVARAAHASTRQLQRLFRAGTGLTVSEYARVRRLREALAMRLSDAAPHWSRIAAERGFTDQAHLTREFLALTGAPPTAAGRQLQRIDHRDVTP